MAVTAGHSISRWCGSCPSKPHRPDSARSPFFPQEAAWDTPPSQSKLTLRLSPSTRLPLNRESPDYKPACRLWDSQSLSPSTYKMGSIEHTLHKVPKAITTVATNWVALKYQKFLFKSSGGRKSKIRVSAGLGSSGRRVSSRVSQLLGVPGSPWARAAPSSLCLHLAPFLCLRDAPLF